METLHKILHVKVLFLLATVPFMLICPLSIFSIATGFPYDNWRNDDKIDEFAETLDIFALPQSTYQIGTVYAQIGGIDKLDECDLISAKIIVSSLPQEKLSELLLKTFQETVLDETKVPNIELVNKSNIKLFQIVSENGEFENEDISVNFKKDMNVNSISLATDEKAYVFYLVNYNVFGSRDYRCK